MNEELSYLIRGDVKISTYKPHTNHKKPSVSSHTLAPTTICDPSHSVCGSPLTDPGHISSVTYVCHPLWFVCGHRKGILTSPLTITFFPNHKSLKPKERHSCTFFKKNNLSLPLWCQITIFGYLRGSFVRLLQRSM